jgi:hypothetical protein
MLTFLWCDRVAAPAQAQTPEKMLVKVSKLILVSKYISYKVIRFSSFADLGDKVGIPEQQVTADVLK